MNKHDEKLVNAIDAISSVITTMSKDADKNDYTAQLSYHIGKNIPQIARAIATMDREQAMKAGAEAVAIIVQDNPEAETFLRSMDFGKTISMFVTGHALMEYYLATQKEEGAEAPSL